MTGYHEFHYKKSATAKVSDKCSNSIGVFTSIDENVLIEDTSDKEGIIIGARCKIKRGVVIRSYGGYVHIGNRVSIGENCIIAGHGGVVIGDYTVIAGMCYISAANHIFSEKCPIRFQGEKAEGIEIGKNVWIGGGTMITDGVKIGEGCVIGAKSLVTNDMPPRTICYGTPCRVIEKISMEGDD